MLNFLKKRIFFEWHKSYHKWMLSIAKSDLDQLERELTAIRWEIGVCEDDYLLDMLNGQEAIVQRMFRDACMIRDLKKTNDYYLNKK